MIGREPARERSRDEVGDEPPARTGGQPVASERSPGQQREFRHERGARGSVQCDRVEVGGEGESLSWVAGTVPAQQRTGREAAGVYEGARLGHRRDADDGHQLAAAVECIGRGSEGSGHEPDRVEAGDRALRNGEFRHPVLAQPHDRGFDVAAADVHAQCPDG